jgi:Cohesin domain
MTGFALAALWGFSCFLHAQEVSKSSGEEPHSDPKQTTRLVLEDASGEPGDFVIVPIYFTPAEHVVVGRLNFQISYVSKNLEFTKIEPGLAADQGDISLQAEVNETANEKGLQEQTLSITSKPSSKEPEEKGIPAGLLAYLTLRISDNGRPATITLRASAEADELGSGNRLPNVQAVDAKVEIKAAGNGPEVVCFFFAH